MTRITNAFAVVTLLAAALPVGAEPPPGGDPPPSCIERVTAQFYYSPATVALGESTTLYWSVNPNGCSTVTQSLAGQAVPRSGWRVITPPRSNSSWTLSLRQGSHSKSYTAPVKVMLPTDEWGRINITISSNDQAGLFVQAISSDESTNAIVRLQDHVQLDLTHLSDIHIRPGVQIIGGRSPSQPGPLVFTNSYPNHLFVIGQYWPADNVRITGIRLRGADGSAAPAGSPASTGLFINSSLNVEVDNNEISGWHVAGISVEDSFDRIDRRNGRGAVRIHDNDIHHNQQIGVGYGVVISDGAYALVEKNTFGYNRHAIAGDGSFGAGYVFYRNRVDPTGGHHATGGPFPYPYRTHQIDMHGQDDCWGADGYCGVAGEYMDVRYNGVRYTAGTAIRLRGTPTERMDVAHNAFAHALTWGNWHWWYGALEQTDGEDGIRHWANSMHVPDTELPGVCDFDGDGVNDTFVADGALWRFAGGAASNGWRYLNTSTLRAGDLDLGDLDGDGICDVRVRADGRVARSGRTPLDHLERTDLLTRSGSAGQLRLTRLDGGGMGAETVHAVAADREVVGAGDFDGDGDSDILLRAIQPVVLPGGYGRKTWILFVQDGAVTGEAEWKYSSGGGGVQGIADFDGDGRSDVLWLDEEGRLTLWHWGVGPVANVSWRNAGGVVPADWRVKAVDDFNGDGYADIAWRHDNGQVAIWQMVGSIFTGDWYPGTPDDPGLTWTIQGVGDFDADGRSDLLWRHAGGWLAIWFGGSHAGAAYPTWRNLGGPADPSWQIKGVSDFNGDGRSDILWTRTADGLSSIWMMDGGSNVGESPYFTIDNDWAVQGLMPVR